MSNGRILVVEDDVDISNMLRIYFDSQGYEVWVAARGQEALDTCRRKLPNIIVLDIMLPDIDGYEVCRRLRGNLRTSHIPILFLTQRDERSDKIAGLELGADDYITKPFDIEELKWRVQNALRRATYESLTSPTTGLPSGKLIEEQLKNLMRRNGWTILYVGINDFEPFNEVQGFVAGDDVLRFVAMLLTEVVDELGTPNDFIGHVGGDDFILITTAEKAPLLRDTLIERFDAQVGTFYPFRDREKGFMAVVEADGTETEVSLMSLAIGLVPEGAYADIREITEVAAAARRDTTR
jgi:PleD family two-component response regulator